MADDYEARAVTATGAVRVGEWNGFPVYVDRRLPRDQVRMVTVTVDLVTGQLREKDNVVIEGPAEQEKQA